VLNPPARHALIEHVVALVYSGKAEAEVDALLRNVFVGCIAYASAPPARQQ